MNNLGNLLILWGVIQAVISLVGFGFSWSFEEGGQKLFGLMFVTSFVMCVIGVLITK